MGLMEVDLLLWDWQEQKKTYIRILSALTKIPSFHYSTTPLLGSQIAQTIHLG